MNGPDREPSRLTRRQRLALWGTLAVGTLLRLGYAWGADGTFHPDDIHQSLEPAHGLVYGTGLRFWEFEVGARPYTLPALYAGILWLLKLVGVTEPEWYTRIARLLTALIGATWPWLSFRLGRALHSTAAGLASAFVVATWYVFVLLAPRAFNHAFSVTFALWGLALVLEERQHGFRERGEGGQDVEPVPRTDRSARRLYAAGFLLGLAFAFRPQEGLAFAGLLLFLLLDRASARLRRTAGGGPPIPSGASHSIAPDSAPPAATGTGSSIATADGPSVATGTGSAAFGPTLARLMAGAVLPVLLLGLLDWATWGLPFHSLFAYLHANVGLDVSSAFGRMPWHFYATRLAVLLGPGVALLLFLPFGRRSALLLAVTVAGLPLLCHSLVPNKQVRFVLLAVIVLFVAACAGLATIGRSLAAGIASRRGLFPKAPAPLLVASLALAWCASSALRASTLTFADFGLYAGLPEEPANPWTFRRDCNRALAFVGRQQDLCGVAVFPSGSAVHPNMLPLTGGYTYLHRGVPLVAGFPPSRLKRLFDTVVTCQEAGAPPIAFADRRTVATIGDCVVARRQTPTECDHELTARLSPLWNRRPR